jgi:hypothetical protein
MKRLALATGAVAGLLTLGMTGALVLAPSAGATNRFLIDGTHATPATHVKPGSVWTLTAGPGECNVQTFAAGGGVTTDTGYTGTWTKPTRNKIKESFPSAPATYKAKYSRALGGYTGTLVLAGTSYPNTTLTPGATAGC